MADSVDIDRMAAATGLTVPEIEMLGRPPYKLLVPHPTSRRYRLPQITWARTLAELHTAKGLSWLEIRAWAERRQNPGALSARPKPEDDD